jgi:hypothetical protein
VVKIRSGWAGFFCVQGVYGKMSGMLFLYPLCLPLCCFTSFAITGGGRAKQDFLLLRSIIIAQFSVPPLSPPGKSGGGRAKQDYTLLQSIPSFCTIHSLPVFQGGPGWVKKSLVPFYFNQLSTQLKLKFFFFFFCTPSVSPWKIRGRTC